MSVTGAAAYEGALDREARRGVNTVTFEVPGDRRDEVRVIPERLSAKCRGKNAVKSAAQKDKLAGFDLCRAGNVEDERLSAKPSFDHVKGVLVH